MATTASTMRLFYDPSTDVVRVRAGNELTDCVAVPLEDLTIFVTNNLDSVVGLNIQDLPTFVDRYVPDQVLPREASGEALFEAARPHIGPLMDLFLRNLGPVAKDRVAHWDELVREAECSSRA